MTRSPVALWLAAVALAACSLSKVDLANKHCPCASGWTCNTATSLCVQGGSDEFPQAGGGGTGDAGAPTSGASGENGGAANEGATPSHGGKPNPPAGSAGMGRGGRPSQAGATNQGGSKNHGDGTSEGGTTTEGGAPQGGGGATDAGAAGDSDHAGEGGAPECGVLADERLHCTNQRGDVYAAADYTSGAVDELRTTYSWFDCWTTGVLHNGGNRTWYHTQGDVYGAWGFVPAAYLNTTSEFDLDPSAQGLHACEPPP